MLIDISSPQPLQLSETLDELLGAMCEEDPLKRVALLHVLEVMDTVTVKLLFTSVA